MPHHDTIFRNARLIDGAGAPSQPADLAMDGDRISAIGDLSSSTANRDVDVEGKILAPGFIDSHCHDDNALLQNPLLEAKVSQGVTTVVNGNCGLSVAPVFPERGDVPRPMDILIRDGSPRFPDFASYFAALDADPPAVNSVCFCGHANLRHAVMDDLQRPATTSEISQMCVYLKEAMEAGALGMSTGLYYPPARKSSTEEVVEIAKTLAAYGGMYVTHMRDEGEYLFDSLEETFRIGREAGVPVVISHHKCVGPANHGKSKVSLKMIDEARKAQTVGLDVYPYSASSTIIQPERVELCERVMITWSKPMPEAAGRDLAEIAAEMGCSLAEAAEKLVPGGAIYFQMSEEDVSRILAYPDSMVGSDGIVQDAHPHPRAWGTFPRVLGHYSRDQELFPLEAAVRKMTSLTAKTFGIEGRGELKVGNFADLVIFDPDTVIDTADFADPCQPALGIEAVYVNGTRVWNEGRTTGVRPGRAIRRNVRT